MLTRKNDAPLDFDFDKVLEQSKDNPVFYVQYAHARAHSVAAPRRRGGVRASTTPRWPRPTSRRSARPGELALMRKLAEWPRQVEIAAASHEPHRIAFYLYDLASEFHSLQHQGKLDPGAALPARGRARRPRRARLALVRATAVVISAGLGILGVTPMDEMR